MNLRRIDVILFIGIKEKLHKNICKRNKVLRKGLSFVPVLKKMYFFRIFKQKPFFFQKTILKIKVTAFRVQKIFFSFLKGKKGRGVYVLCFKTSKMLRIGQVMRVL